MANCFRSRLVGSCKLVRLNVFLCFKGKVKKIYVSVLFLQLYKILHSLLSILFSLVYIFPIIEFNNNNS